MAQEKLSFIIDAENRAKREIDQAKGQLEGLKGRVQNMQPAFKQMAVVGTTAFAAVGAGIYSLTQDATEAQEIFNKFDVVFQDVSTEAEKVAQDLRNNFGLAESSAKDLLSATGDMLTGFGLSGGAALELAEKTNKLAVDLASFTNIEGGAERASKALTKALLGERESVKELGIAILEEDVKAKVEAMKAAGKFTDETERQQKAMATLEIAVSQSKNAIGDFARTQDSLANKQRVLQQRTKEMRETIGSVFIPVLQELVNKIEPVISKVTDWVEKNPALTKNIIAVTLAVSGLVAVVGLLGLALPAIITGFGLLIGPLGIVLASLGALAVVVWKNKEAVASFVQDGIEKMKEAWEKVQPLLQRAWSIFKSLWNVAVDLLTPAFRSLWASLKELWEALVELWDLISPVLLPVLKVLATVVGVVVYGAFITLIGVITKLADWLATLITIVIKVFTKITETIVNAIKDIIKSIDNWISTTTESIKTGWNNVLEFFKNLWNDIVGIFTSAYDKILNIVNKIKGFVSDVKSAASGIVSNVAGGITDRVSGWFNQGGTVPRTGMYMLHRGEQIATEGSSGGTVVNINGGTYLSEDVAEDIGDMIIRRLKLNRRI